MASKRDSLVSKQIHQLVVFVERARKGNMMVMSDCIAATMVSKRVKQASTLDYSDCKMVTCRDNIRTEMVKFDL